LAVAPLVLSGANEPPSSALAAAHRAGVDIYFWEPRYRTLSRFLSRHRDLRVIAGTYHAEPAQIELDVDRALRCLRRDVVDVFLLFWTRSPARVDHDAFATLDRLRTTGKVRAIGFSTHHRDLARAALERDPWDVVMIRHSAAHPGIETELLPTARERGCAIVTFSALCYGRMLAGPSAPSAAECYRYSLSQPGVTCCASAPRNRRELVENLDVLREPTLPAERLAELREHGLAVRAESQRFNALLRQPTRDAAAAAREMLAHELPPEPIANALPLPRPARVRSRTSLGRIRRR
jgi:aryl-alcohol dehydrogenase-like predicted oxidoreductase